MAVRAGSLPAEAAAEDGFCPAEFADADLHAPVGYARALQPAMSSSAHRL